MTDEELSKLHRRQRRISKSIRMLEKEGFSLPVEIITEQERLLNLLRVYSDWDSAIEYNSMEPVMREMRFQIERIQLEAIERITGHMFSEPDPNSAPFDGLAYWATR